MLHKAIKGYEDYLVTDTGQVYSLKSGKYMKLQKNNKEYVTINLCKNGRHKNFLVHRLVAQAFIENPNNKIEVDHINRIKTDNRIQNLRWSDRDEQLGNRDMTKYKGTSRKSKGTTIIEKINDEVSLGYLSLNSVPNIKLSTLRGHIRKSRTHFTSKGREFFTEPKA